jgi:hypothetical protein
MRTSSCLLRIGILWNIASEAGAVAVPILDPGFEMYVANTLDPIPDDRLPNQGAPGAGSGPVENVSLLNFDTFAPAESSDIPAGWTATGQKPNASANTGRVRCDDCFQSDSGTVAFINSFHDANNPSTQGRFAQTIVGVAVQPNTLYKATVEVSDLDIMGRGPFMNPEDNVILGDPARIVLSLSAAVSPTEIVDLGGTLEFTDITPGGFGAADERISGAKELLTLTVLTGDTVPAGDLHISFTAAGVFGELPSSFAASAQTFFDNVTLDATPFDARLAGDFTTDDIVDAADYVVWRKSNIDGPQGYLDWRANFGAVGSDLRSAVAPGSVPEPATLVVVSFAASCVLARHRLSARSAT